ncbi:hypothetical protein U9M48_016276 [Paspalum notatum var. saurae]|uniref:Uncharacterized protein n=1 Tax=Paspalum notatum var. saurae TaxID=547442 RepID=A0AAQ3T5W8_PASNO
MPPPAAVASPLTVSASHPRATRGHSSLPSADPLLPSTFQPKEPHLHPPSSPPEDPVAGCRRQPPRRPCFPPPHDATTFLDFLRGHSSLPSADPLLPSAFQPKEPHLHPPSLPPEDPVAAAETTTGAQIHALELPF